MLSSVNKKSFVIVNSEQLLEVSTGENVNIHLAGDYTLESKTCDLLITSVFPK